MDVEKIFHMTGGHGDNSYSRNSSLQKKGSDMVKHIIKETIEELYQSTIPQTLTVADLGCSSGPNSLSMIRDLYRTVEDAYRRTQVDGGAKTPPPQVSVFLNDLPSNDFNSVFKALPELYEEIGRTDDEGSVRSSWDSGSGLGPERQTRPSLFVAASPGSFYGRLFHPDSLHFVYSSYSLHWLSKVPPDIYDEEGESLNKGCIYICENSPPAVISAYVKQFQVDFSRFIRLRSQELVDGGRMVLVFLGRDDPNQVDRGNSFLWQLLVQCFTLLISQGRVEKEKLDSYDVHFYAPCKEEVEEIVRKEGSFKLERFEKFLIERQGEELGSYGKAVASTVRAVQESMISHHFGHHILDDLFHIYARLVDEEMCRQDIRPLNFLLLLTKL